MSAIFFHSPSFLQNDGTSSTMIISWQHKWISLAILSGLIFLFRFHIMGWILSRFICYNLAKTLIKQRIDVKVQQVKLRPIQLIQMEIFSEKGWRIQFSKISIHSHFTEFFRSFGHKKIIMLELDEVRVKVENIDEEWLLEEHKIHQEKEERQEKIQQISSSSFTSTTTSTKRKGKINPIGFLRFIDLHINQVEVNVDCFGIHGEFSCSDLCVGILDVLVKQNLLHINLNASAIRLQVQPTTTSLERSGSKHSHSTKTLQSNFFRDYDDGKLNITGGLMCHIPKLAWIFDVQLRSRNLIGCKISGSNEDIINIQICTQFLEFLCLKKMELIRKGFFLPKTKGSSISTNNGSHTLKRNLDKGSPLSTLRGLDISDIHFQLLVVNQEENEEEGLNIPLQLSAQIVCISMSTSDEKEGVNGIPSLGVEDHVASTESDNDDDNRDEDIANIGTLGSEPNSVTGRRGSQMSCGLPIRVITNAIIRNICARTAPGTNYDFFTVSSIEIKSVKKEAKFGVAEIQTGEIVITFNSRVLQFCHALAQVEQRFIHYESQINTLIQSIMKNEEEYISSSSRLSLKRRRKQTEWQVSLHTISWRMKIHLTSRGLDDPEEVIIFGLNTKMNSTLYPKDFDNSSSTDTLSSHIIEISQVGADVITRVSKEKMNFLFFGIEYKITKRMKIENMQENLTRFRSSSTPQTSPSSPPKRTNSVLNYGSFNDSVTKTIQTQLRFKSVCINGFEKETSTRHKHSSALFSEVSFDCEEHETYESKDTEITVYITETDVKCSHQEHECLLIEIEAMKKMYSKIKRAMKPSLNEQAPFMEAAPTSTAKTTEKSTLDDVKNVKKESPEFDSKGSSNGINSTPNAEGKANDFSKTFEMSVRLKNANVRLYDITDVTDFALFSFTESRIVHQKKKHHEKNAFQSAFARIQCSVDGLGTDLLPVVEISNLSSLQNIILGPQRMLAKVSVQNDVYLGDTRIFIRPNFRLMLLYRRLDEMITLTSKYSNRKARGKSGSLNGTVDSPTKKTQGVSINCTKITGEIFNQIGRSFEGSPSPPGSPRYGQSSSSSSGTFSKEHSTGAVIPRSENFLVYNIQAENMQFKANVSKYSAITDNIFRLLQTMKRDEKIGNSLCYPETIDQIITIDGSVNMETMSFSRFSKVFATLRDLEFRFCLSDIIRKKSKLMGIVTTGRDQQEIGPLGSESYLSDSSSSTRSSTGLSCNSISSNMSLSTKNSPSASINAGDKATGGANNGPKELLLPPRTTIFDLSALSREAELIYESKVIRGFTEKMVPILKDAFNTESNSEEYIQAKANTNWRLKYMGNVEVCFTQWNISFPYGERRYYRDEFSNTTPKSHRRNAPSCEDKIMHVEFHQIALTFRQFQKVILQFQKLQVTLEDVERRRNSSSSSIGSTSSTNEIETPLQLVLLPRTKIEGLVHWKDIQSDKKLHSSHVSEYSISLDLSIRAANPNACPATQLPQQNEAFIAINWDYFYPLLVYLSNEEDKEEANEESAGYMSKDSRLLCTGVQWNVSIDLLQMAWWDAMSHDCGLLVLLNDFLSHGTVVKKTLRTPVNSFSRRLSIITSPEELSRLESESSKLIPLEVIVYLDQFRGYLLRDAHGGAYSEPSNPTHNPFSSTGLHDSFPFLPINPNDFFFEAASISYRYTSNLGDLNGSGENRGVSLDESLELPFEDRPAVVMNKMHDQFIPVDCEFRVPTATWSHNGIRYSPNVSYESSLDPLISLLATAATANACSSSNWSGHSTSSMSSSSLKSPNSWANSLRSRMLKLKRRTASMDNLLLNDGSCPIQVDSMKLLWTIETRDCVFYTTAVAFDGFYKIMETKQQHQRGAQSDIETPNSGNLSKQGNMETNTSGNWTPTFSGTSANGGNSNSTLPISPSVSGRRESTVRDNVYRRSTTRDTLLELLQQGKLGPKKHPPSGSPGKSDSSANGSEDQQIPKSVIWLKKYTIDIHDAQISLYDESSQSNVLIASKHIHLENGLDETHTTSIVNLNFDYVTGHIAPIGVDVSAGMIWYTHANTSIHHSSNSPGESNPISGPNLSTGAPSSTPDSSLLKQVMEECTLTCSYTQDLSTNAISVDSELSVMNLSTDRHQFYQLLNVLRHVLLAPPTLLRRRSRKLRTRVNPVSNGGNSSGSDGVIASLDKGLGSEISVLPTGSTNSNSSTCPISVANNKKLHLMLAEEMKHRESKAAQAGNFRVTPLALRRIAFRVNGCQWRLRLSPETTGGDHDFVEFRIQGVTGSHVYLGTQTTKMNVNIQWMEMKNLRPGPSSIAFEDAMAVLKPKLLNPDQQSQKGMLSIRAESGPITRVMGQKLRVLDLLEVSIFPEIPYMIVMQLAADFYELMYKFFFEQVAPPPTEAHHENDSEQVLFGRKSSISPPNFKTFKSIHLPSPSSPTSPARTIGNRRKSILPSGYGHARMSVSSPTGNNDDGLGGGNALPSTVSVVTVHGVDSIVLDDEDGSSDGKHELFYFKYVRVGNIRLRINCNGFFVNLKDFDLDLPPYVCQGKLCTVKKLLGKFETHLKWYITKESASSGLSHFKNKFLKWTPNLNPDKEKNNKKKEANKHSAENISSSSLHLIGSSSTSSSSSSTTTTATTITTIAPSLSTNAIHSGTVKSSKDSSITANAQVLFGPYHLSGISTIPPSTPTNGNGNGGSTLTPTSSTTSIF